MSSSMRSTEPFSMISLMREIMPSTLPGRGYFSTRLLGLDLVDFDSMSPLSALTLSELDEVFCDNRGH